MKTSNKVLVVEDQEGIRKVLRACLEKEHGCAVTEAVNGLEAAGRLCADSFDLVLTDLVMPVMTGLELLGWIRRNPRLAKMPVIILSCLDEETDTRKALALGVSDYLLKPFSPDSLRRAVSGRLTK